MPWRNMKRFAKYFVTFTAFLSVFGMMVDPSIIDIYTIWNVTALVVATYLINVKAK